MSKIGWAVVTGLLLSSAQAMAQDSERIFRADLEGAQQVPPVQTDAQGTTQMRFRRGALQWQIRVRQLQDVTRAHIHCAAAGQNGAIGVTLIELAEPQWLTRIEGIVLEPDPGNTCGWTSLTDVRDAILAGEAYVNVHSATHPDGELRGQLDGPR